VLVLVLLLLLLLLLLVPVLVLLLLLLMLLLLLLLLLSPVWVPCEVGARRVHLHRWRGGERVSIRHVCVRGENTACTPYMRICVHARMLRIYEPRRVRSY